MAKEIDAKDAERRLLRLRDELRGVREAAAEARAPVALDQTRQGRLSRMDALRDQAMALETERRRAVELTRIEAALGRIADGTYGICLTCGDAIAPKRLDLNPAVAICVDCARSAG